MSDTTHKAPTPPAGLRWDELIKAWVSDSAKVESKPAHAQCDEPPEQRGPIPLTITLTKVPQDYWARYLRGWIEISFRYHAAFIWEMKREIPGAKDPRDAKRRWIAETKSWQIHPDYFAVLKMLIRKHFKRVIILRAPGVAESVHLKKVKGNIEDTAFAPKSTQVASSALDELFACGRNVQSGDNAEQEAQSSDELKEIKDMVTVEEDL